ncbi:class I SAM-dependent methyltransferase [Paenibacillus sp. GCM10023248]|uniref:class I SAM-dependent methyltransferase n=1 Tax=Bacillales TaxID=1385 RepID=UPI0023781669|nr:MULTISPECIES: class I SAM-dependent methyltransferase [Bacillales]MDD9268139.1 class I SAM-dependent methyltransferase [Paenibacillus sp. MAHUQ-63]MDR6879818.1 ubiquinone/menaquinone biosynthesis C-methylase UbiE [Bacillus sp. 3255]
MLENVRTNNVQRFAGFGALYDQNRPTAPAEVVKLLTAYLSSQPHTVVDVGCGTGLSSFIWLNAAQRIIGVEPSDDMRTVAISKWEAVHKPEQLRFVKGLSHELELPDASADIITCSQSFHWMEPQSTLREFARVLRPGGVFAAYDCDWPPALNWQVEEAFRKLNALSDARAAELSPQEEQARKWSKEEHLQQISGSGLFRYSREIVFHNWEVCTAERYANIALSQGGLQTALKRGADDLQAEITAFREAVAEAFGGEERDVLFGYRMRMGVK